MWIHCLRASSLEGTGLGCGKEWKQEGLWVLPSLIIPVNVSILHPFYSLPSLESAFRDFSSIPQFCSRAGDSCYYLWLRRDRVHQTQKLKQAIPAHPFMEVFSHGLCEKHLTTASDFWGCVCWIQPFQPLVAPQMNFWVIKNHQIVSQKIVFSTLLSFFRPRILALLEELDI